MTEWDAIIVSAQAPDTPDKGAILARAMNEIEAQGWTIATVLTNGLDRWTIVAKKTTEPAPT